MIYQVQPGDTIAKVKQLLGADWNTLRRLNPHAVGRSSKTGNWFLKQGASLTVEKGAAPAENRFAAELKKSREQNPEAPTAPRHAPSEKWLEYTIKPGDTLWALAVKRFHVNLTDILNANQIEDPDKIQPGQKIRIPLASHPRQQEVVASWYGKAYDGKPMANGEIFRMHADTIAHRELPFGTRVELKNPETGQTVKAVVTDRGPFIEGRDVDLSYGLAKKLSLLTKGVGRLEMRII